MSIARHAVVLLVVLAAGLSGCLLQPVSEDRRMGAEYSKMVEEQQGLVEHPSADHLRKVGARLEGVVDDDRFDFSFHVVGQAEPNAFALLGGWVYFTRGILVLMNSEDELAGVLGHEMTHVTERHSAEQNAKQRLPNLLKVPGRMLGVVNENLGNLFNAPIEGVSGLRLARYGRGQESESDRVGMERAAKAGYDPGALAPILQRIEDVVETLTGKERERSYFDSHPMTENRVRAIEKHAKELDRRPPHPVAKNRAGFLAKLDGLVVGKNPAFGVFDGSRYLHPNLGFTLEFPDGWDPVVTARVAGALEPNGQALIVIGVHSRGHDPEKPAREFKRQLLAEHGIGPTEERSVRIGKWPGYVVTLEDGSGRHEVGYHVLWVAGNGYVFQLIGVSTEENRPHLRKSALSLRPATRQERESVTVLRLRLARAKKGETLAGLGKRSGNALEPGMTAVLNGLPEDVRLDEGQIVKIGVQERFLRR